MMAVQRAQRSRPFAAFFCGERESGYSNTEYAVGNGLESLSVHAHQRRMPWASLKKRMAVAENLPHVGVQGFSLLPARLTAAALLAAPPGLLDLLQRRHERLAHVAWRVIIRCR